VREEPSGFDAFWQETLEEARAFPLDATFEPVAYGLKTVEAFDGTFRGYAGQPIKAWLLLPRHRSEPLPCVVEYIGYYRTHRNKVDTVFGTLACIDGMNFAVRCKARPLFSVALRDLICPPSTVFAAYNHFAGRKHIKVYEFNEHEGGGSVQAVEKVRNLTFLWE
jgi:cephalosporin-C deacetylase-like acetyl esterase